MTPPVSSTLRPSPEAPAAERPAGVVAPLASRLTRVWRGPPTDPAWARPAFVGLLAVTAILYLWNLGASGWANSYYSAATQAASQSWKAFFFGSTDASNFITIDKTPASIWPMAISARIFGVSSWSILVPQALEGMGVVAVLYATVKRWFSPGAALLAGAVAALTPVAALMFRFNNPDALLVLLLTASAYAMTRALEAGKTRWLVAAGVFVGFAFLAKELQAFLVLPGFALVYLLAGPPKLAKRIVQVVWLGVATLVAGGWWVAIVQLTPASQRPYIGGSQNNSFWNVLFGYNGLGRITGNETGSVGGGAGPGGPGGGLWGPTGWNRLFNESFGGQASWLIPGALVILVAGLVLTATRARTDRTRAALFLWGSWLLVTGVAISFGKGIIHEYYTVALAPAIGALVGIGGGFMWRHRDQWFGRLVLSLTVAVSAVWASVLLGRIPDWLPALRPLVLLVGLGVAVALLVPAAGRVAVAVLGAAVVVGLAGPAAYTLSTVSAPHEGALPLAGPSGQRLGFGLGGGPGRGPPPGFPGPMSGGQTGYGFGGPGGFGGGAGAGFPVGGPGGGPLPVFGGSGNVARAGPGPGPGSGMAGLLNGAQVTDEFADLLREGSEGFRWTAAAIGANNAASYQLASGEPVMAIGGFNGSDPAPTLAQFRALVDAGEIHWFVGGAGLGGAMRGQGDGAVIARWVQSNFERRAVGSTDVYDLTSPTSSTTN